MFAGYYRGSPVDVWQIVALTSAFGFISSVWIVCSMSSALIPRPTEAAPPAAEVHDQDATSASAAPRLRWSSSSRRRPSDCTWRSYAGGTVAGQRRGHGKIDRLFVQVGRQRRVSSWSRPHPTPHHCADRCHAPPSRVRERVATFAQRGSSHLRVDLSRHHRRVPEKLLHHGRTHLLRVGASQKAPQRMRGHALPQLRSLGRPPDRGPCALPGQRAPREFRKRGSWLLCGERWTSSHPIRVEGIHGERPHGNDPPLRPCRTGARQERLHPDRGRRRQRVASETRPPLSRTGVRGRAASRRPIGESSAWAASSRP